VVDLLAAEWVYRLKHYQNLFIAFSGGLDSTVLLHALQFQSALSAKLIAVHVNHQLLPQADDWQNHCADICRQWRIRFIAKTVSIDGQTNIEAKARQVRYEIFSQLVGQDDALLTAHHADDQVETFFLNLLRGAGVTGLAGMPAVQTFGNGQLVRPLLMQSQQALLEYAQEAELDWIDDPSNLDCRLRRNWLRHRLMPLLRQHWPSASVNILRSIKLLQQEFAAEHAKASEQLSACLETPHRLAIAPLLRLTNREQCNVLRQWFKQNHLKMPSQIQLQQLFQSVIHAKQDANPVWAIEDFQIRRFDGKLYLLHQSVFCCSKQTILWDNFPKDLRLTDWEQHLRANLIDDLPELGKVEIRFRQGGERFRYRGKTRILKKLLQAWHIPPWQRECLPLLYIDDELAAVADLAVSDHWKNKMLPLTILYP